MFRSTSTSTSTSTSVQSHRRPPMLATACPPSWGGDENWCVHGLIIDCSLLFFPRACHLKHPGPFAPCQSCWRQVVLASPLQSSGRLTPATGAIMWRSPETVIWTHSDSPPKIVPLPLPPTGWPAALTLTTPSASSTLLTPLLLVHRNASTHKLVSVKLIGDAEHVVSNVRPQATIEVTNHNGMWHSLP
jgi:hypothetical protein